MASPGQLDVPQKRRVQTTTAVIKVCTWVRRGVNRHRHFPSSAGHLPPDTMASTLRFLALVGLLGACRAAPVEESVALPRHGVTAPTAAPAGVWQGTMGIAPYQKGASGLTCTTCQPVYAKTFGEPATSSCVLSCAPHPPNTTTHRAVRSVPLHGVASSAHHRRHRQPRSTPTSCT